MEVVNMGVKGIHRFSGVSNCYLEYNGDIFLVDTGMPGKSGEVIDFIQKYLDKNKNELKYIVITHNHIDHIGSLDKIKEKTGARVAIHTDDAEELASGKNQGGNPVYGVLVKVMKFIYRMKQVKPDVLLEDGDTIAGYHVIHTPGHTPGSICLYNPENKVLFAGDNIRLSKGKLESPGSRLLPEPDKYRESMKKIADLDMEVILTGHGQPVTEKAKQKLLEFVDTL